MSVIVIAMAIGTVVALMAAKLRSSSDPAANVKAVVVRRGGDPTTSSVRIGEHLCRVRAGYTNSAPHIECEVALAAPGFVVFSLTARSLMDQPGVGNHDIALGDPELDWSFVVRGNDPALVARLWTPARRRQMVTTFLRATVVCDGTVLRIVHPRAHSIDGIDAAVTLLDELLTTDPFGLAALRALPGASMRHDDGKRFPYAVIPGNPDVIVGPLERIDEIAFTAARIPPVGTVPVPDDAKPLLDQLGGGELENLEHETRVVWPTIVREPEHLLTAVKLLRRMSNAPTLGAFR